MKKTKSLWIKFHVLTINIILITLFLSCEDKDVFTNDTNNADKNTIFTLVKNEYFLSGDDSVYYRNRSLKSILISNPSDSTITRIILDSISVLYQSSLFIIPSGTLPLNSNISKIEVPIPEFIDETNIYSFDRKVFFTQEKQILEKQLNYKEYITVSIPPYSKATLKRDIKEKILQSSFIIELRNNQTELHSIIKGKWVGTLQYFEHSTHLDISKLETR